MKKINIKITLIMLLVSLFTLVANGQSMYREGGMARSQNEPIITQQGDNQLKVHSAGLNYYKIVNGDTFWRFYADETDPYSEAIGKYRKVGNEIHYYDTQGNIVGYIDTNIGRFYSAYGVGESIIKEDSKAVLYDGILTVNTPIDGQYDKYIVDKDLDLVFLGFYLLIY